MENRLPGADVNPYLALAAMIAAGLHGIENELELEPAFEGNAYESDKPRVPHNMYDARDLFAESAIAREAFGQEVVDHYLNRARDRDRRDARPRSPTGSSSAGSRDCERREPPCHRHLRRDRERALGRLGGAWSNLLAAHVLAARCSAPAGWR